MAPETLRQVVRDRSFHPKSVRPGVVLWKNGLRQHSPQPARRPPRLLVPGAGRHRRAGRRRVGQDRPSEQGELREPLTGFLGMHELPGRAQHLFGRERELFDRPAVAVQPAEVLGCQRQRRGQQQRVDVGRVVDRRDAEGPAAGRRVGQDQVLPLFRAQCAARFGPADLLIWRGRREVAPTPRCETAPVPRT